MLVKSLMEQFTVTHVFPALCSGIQPVLLRFQSVTQLRRAASAALENCRFYCTAKQTANCLLYVIPTPYLQHKHKITQISLDSVRNTGIYDMAVVLN